MSRPKVKIDGNTVVWILEHVMPYDGSYTLGVFLDPEVAKKGRTDKGKWELNSEGNWSTRTSRDEYLEFYLLTKHPVRVK